MAVELAPHLDACPLREVEPVQWNRRLAHCDLHFTVRFQLCLCGWRLLCPRLWPFSHRGWEQQVPSVSVVTLSCGVGISISVSLSVRVPVSVRRPSLATKRGQQLRTKTLRLAHAT
eukprot:3639091-Rhodomonas_salina.5